MYSVISGTARSDLSPKIEALIDLLGIRWIEQDVSFRTVGYKMPTTTQGAYLCQQDAIVMRKAPLLVVRKTDYVFLHELGHWTGAVGRLSRQIFVLAERGTGFVGIPAVHQEEAVAELVARRLSVYFGILSDKEAFRISMQYIPQYFHANLEQANKDADAAVSYILNLVYERAAKVA